MDPKSSDARSLLQQLDEEFGVGLAEGIDERRGSQRRGCIAPAVLVPGAEDGSLDEEGRRDGIALDVSEGGMRVLTRNLDDAAFLEVRVPGTDGWIVFRGRVVRRRELARGYREFGLRLAT